MKTRCHKTRFLSPLLAVSLLLVQSNAHGQFNKYRSQTRFNPGAPAPVENTLPDTETMSADDAAAALKAAENIETAQAGGNGDSEEAENDSAFETDNDDDANSETFGDRPSPGKNAQPKSAKYVNLNPETAFGPEIVSSFDFPDTDIMEITKHMQKLTGINLILDKDVKGKSFNYCTNTHHCW